jgi:hypothetical protein
VDPTVASALELFAHRVRGALGTDLVGVYLTGSAVTERFRPSTSDVDLFVVCGGPLSPRTCVELDRMHAELILEHPWGASLDVEYAPLSGLRPDGVDGAVSWTRDGGLVPGSTRVASDDILGVRSYGRAILGPLAPTVFPAVDAALFRRQTVEYLRDLLSRPRTRPGARPEVSPAGSPTPPGACTAWPPASWAPSPARWRGGPTGTPLSPTCWVSLTRRCGETRSRAEPAWTRSRSWSGVPRRSSSG